jgi:pyruvate dehydrogenase E1 component alpha subunit
MMDMRSRSFADVVLAFEKRCMDHLSEIACPVHLSFGMEHLCADLHEWLRPQDWLFSDHRSHGYYLAKGGDPDLLWDEIRGLESGVNGGFSGSQEFSDPKVNFHATSILGGLVGAATGTALALKLDKSDAIVVCCFGDAVAEQGVLWESLNFAALKRLPIAYICVNNHIADASPIADRQATPIAPRAHACGVNLRWNVMESLICAREGNPSFFEIDVIRQCPHLYMRSMAVTSL